MSLNRQDLEKKLGPLTSKLLKEKGYIAFIDVFIELGYLSEKDVTEWRMKRVPYLEKVIQIGLGKISFIMKTVRKNSQNGQLKESFTAYHSWGKGQKRSLRFTKSGNNQIEKVYSTHFLKPQNKSQKQLKSKEALKNNSTYKTDIKTETPHQSAQIREVK